MIAKALAGGRQLNGVIKEFLRIGFRSKRLHLHVEKPVCGKEDGSQGLSGGVQRRGVVLGALGVEQLKEERRRSGFHDE